MKKIQFAVLALSLLGSALAAAKDSRKPANSDKLDFSLSAPSAQVLQGEEARAFFQKLITEQEDLTATEKKNIEEFSLLGKELESRGYVALEKQPPGIPLAVPLRLVFFREEDQHVPAGNGEKAYVAVSFKIRYSQLYFKNGEKPGHNEPVPSAILQGTLFLKCPTGAKQQCPITGATFHESSIKWDILPSPRGANSSAGGADNK